MVSLSEMQLLRILQQLPPMGKPLCVKVSKREMSSRISPDVLLHERFPRSNRYDPIWIIKNEKGPQPV